jgi:hypothetical protein
MVSPFGDDLDPVVECHTENEFWQLVVAIETAPAFLHTLEQLEDHRERRPVGQASPSIGLRGGARWRSSMDRRNDLPTNPPALTKRQFPAHISPSVVFVSELIAITGIRDHHRLEHLIAIPGIRTVQTER